MFVTQGTKEKEVAWRKVLRNLQISLIMTDSYMCERTPYQFRERLSKGIGRTILGFQIGLENLHVSSKSGNTL